MSDRTYRVRSIAVAAALAAAAGILTMIVVSHADGRTRAPAVQPRVRVLVAARDLAVGASAAQAVATGAVRLRAVDPGTLVPDAVTTPASVRGLVVVQPVFAGEQLTRRRLGRSGTQGFRSELRGSLRILQVPGDASQLLAGTVQAGDHVDVVASVKRGPQQTPYTRIVLRDLLVLEPPSGSGGPGDGRSLSATVQLTADQVQRLFFVLKNGDWSFALRPTAHATTDVAAAPVSAATVLKGR